MGVNHSEMFISQVTGRMRALQFMPQIAEDPSESDQRHCANPLASHTQAPAGAHITGDCPNFALGALNALGVHACRN